MLSHELVIDGTAYILVGLAVHGVFFWTDKIRSPAEDTIARAMRYRLSDISWIRARSYAVAFCDRFQLAK